MIPRLKTARLSPNIPAIYSDAVSVGFVSGDLPFVILHLNKRRVKLWRGQCLPTGGKRIAVENVMARTGDVALMFDGPLSIVGSQSANLEADEYHGEFKLVGQPSGRAGCGFMPTQGAVRILLSGAHDFDVIHYSDVVPSALDHKPVEFMNEGSVPLVSSLGNTLPSVISMFGYYDSSMAMAWAVAAGYTGSVHKLKTVKSGTFELHAGDAMFFTRLGPNAEGKASFRVRDLGSHGGKSVV